MNSIRVATQVKPARATSTVVLFDASKPTKSAATFGRGITRYIGQYGGKQPYTARDARWAVEAMNSADEMSDREWDRLADEAAFLDRYVKGFTSPEV